MELFQDRCHTVELWRCDGGRGGVREPEAAPVFSTWEKSRLECGPSGAEGQVEANPRVALEAHLLCAGPCLITHISSFLALTLGSRYGRYLLFTEAGP